MNGRRHETVSLGRKIAPAPAGAFVFHCARRSSAEDISFGDTSVGVDRDRVEAFVPQGFLANAQIGHP
jgi:hypothetical protein